MQVCLLLVGILSLWNPVYPATVQRGTTHHVTTKVTTTHRPTREPGEFVNNQYMYDRYSHFLCDSHYSRYLHYCMCYHIPYEQRDDIHDPVTLLKIERRMFELYQVGHYKTMNMTELKYYSDRCYRMCTHTNYNPGDNTTLFMIYDDPRMS
ncbi:uncharacterized protein LOC125676090 [Ostrea edulis]|uniref:uncharacterized protein LOC125676090 n=1 Tax=Ostrea edulis TaxID=37623 RepID=UPI0020960323|nr:uncharacterized protein LOC125676090 [Ostrea edulis]